MKRDSAILPFPRAVITVPETTVTGAVAMIHTPMTYSSGNTNLARSRESNGMKPRDEIMAAKGAFNCNYCSLRREVSSARPVMKKAMKMPMVRM